MCIVYRAKEMCAHIFAYAQIRTGGYYQYVYTARNFQFWWNRGSFLAVSASLSSALETQVLAMSSNLSAMLLASAKALHTFAPNWPHQWPHGQDGGSRHSERLISNSKKFCHQWLEPINNVLPCLRNPVTLAVMWEAWPESILSKSWMPSSGRLPSLPATGMFVFCGITLLLLRTDQILSARNYFVGSAPSEIAFQREKTRTCAKDLHR